MKYTLIDNIKYLYKRAFKMYPSLKITLPLMIISAVLLPILSIAIASLAVELITKGSAFKDFLIIIGGIGVLWVSLSTTHKYLFSKIEFQQTMIRMTDFYGKMADKMMEKDYINIEPYDKQNKTLESVIIINTANTIKSKLEINIVYSPKIIEFSITNGKHL